MHLKSNKTMYFFAAFSTWRRVLWNNCFSCYHFDFIYKVWSFFKVTFVRCFIFFFMKFRLLLRHHSQNIDFILKVFVFFHKISTSNSSEKRKIPVLFFFLVALILLGMLEVQHGDVSSIKFQSGWKGQFPVSRSEQQLHQLQFSGRIPNQHSGRNIVAITIWYLCVEVSSSAPVAFKGTRCITHINNKEKKKTIHKTVPFQFAYKKTQSAPIFPKKKEKN